MLRIVVLASIASAFTACKPAPGPTTLGHMAGATVDPARTPAPTPGSPSARLGALVHARVTIAGRAPVPGGELLVFTYRRLEAELGALTAEGHDAQAELAVEQRRCEADRAALDPEEREYLRTRYQSCEALAGAMRFADDQLTPECKALGVVYLDASGQPLDHVVLGGPCVRAIDSFEAYDLTPAPNDELMLTATFETLGELAHGGWGPVQQQTRLHVLGARPGEGVVEQLDVELLASFVGGDCTHGTRHSARIAGPGVLEVYSQKWDACVEARCVAVEEEERADEAAASGFEQATATCQAEPVSAERAEWSADTDQWSPWAPLDYAGTMLPDGIMK